MRFFLLLLLFHTLLISYSQSLADRIEADYSIKEINTNGKQSLIVGKVFFDKTKKTMTHHQTFPAENLLVFKDTTVFLIINDSVAKSKSSALSIDFSIYNLILNNNITDFGLEKFGFELVDVEDREGKVVSKWRNASASAGIVAITQEAGRVDGVIFYDPNGKPLMKQYFNDYEKFGRIYFPTKIFEIISTPFGENKKITTHRNIKVDDFEDEAYYYDLYNSTITELFRSKN